MFSLFIAFANKLKLKFQIHGKPKITQNLQSEFSFQLREPEKFPFKTTSSKLELLSETQFICVAQKTF